MDKPMNPTSARSPQAAPDTKGVMRPMNAKDGKAASSKSTPVVIVAVYVVLILLGVGTGYLLSQKGGGSGAAADTSSVVANNGISAEGKIVGVQDASKYTNCPTGKLEKGGIDGEGTHHLVREGGPSQTAYLTSSIIDLDAYAGKTVKVCGETMQALHAPWLMDVERLELQ